MAYNPYDPNDPLFGLLNSSGNGQTNAQTYSGINAGVTANAPGAWNSSAQPAAWTPTFRSASEVPQYGAAPYAGAKWYSNMQQWAPANYTPNVQWNPSTQKWMDTNWRANYVQDYQTPAQNQQNVEEFLARFQANPLNTSGYGGTANRNYTATTPSVSSGYNDRTSVTAPGTAFSRYLTQPAGSVSSSSTTRGTNGQSSSTGNLRNSDAAIVTQADIMDRWRQSGPLSNLPQQIYSSSPGNQNNRGYSVPSPVPYSPSTTGDVTFNTIMDRWRNSMGQMINTPQGEEGAAPPITMPQRGAGLNFSPGSGRWDYPSTPGDWWTRTEDFGDINVDRGVGGGSYIAPAIPVTPVTPINPGTATPPTGNTVSVEQAQKDKARGVYNRTGNTQPTIDNRTFNPNALSYIGGIPFPGVGGGNTGGTGGGASSITAPTLEGDLSNQMDQAGTTALQQFLSLLQSGGYSNPYASAGGNFLQQLMSAYPSNLTSSLMSQLGGLNTIGNNLYNTGMGNTNTVQGILNQILTQGLPNQQAIQGIVPGQLGQYSNLMGGNGTYGVQDLLSQVMLRGLPGQNNITSLISNPTNSMLSGANGTGGVNDILSQIINQGLPGQQNIQGLTDAFSQAALSGGLTPEYIKAARELILQPSQEALAGKLNRQGGGQAAVAPTSTVDQSPLFSEMQRRNERDFNNQLIMAGLQNQGTMGNLANQSFANVAGAAQPYFSMAQTGGQNALNTQLNSFNAVANSAYPYINMAGNLGNQGIQNALSAFQAVPSSAYPYFNLAGNLGQNQYTQGLGALTSGLGLGNNLLGTTGDQLNSLLSSLSNTGLGYNQLQNNLLSTMLNNVYGNQAANNANNAANLSAWGNIIGAGVQSLPWIIKLLGGRTP